LGQLQEFFDVLQLHAPIKLPHKKKIKKNNISLDTILISLSIYQAKLEGT